VLRDGLAAFGSWKGTGYTNPDCSLLFLAPPEAAPRPRRLVASYPARARPQVMLCGIYGGQSGNGTGFLRVLRFPLPIVIPLTAPHSSSSIIRVGQVVADESS
jgi:hypothetical protein